MCVMSVLVYISGHGENTTSLHWPHGLFGLASTLILPFIVDGNVKIWAVIAVNQVDKFGRSDSWARRYLHPVHLTAPNMCKMVCDGSFGKERR